MNTPPLIRVPCLPHSVLTPDFPKPHSDTNPDYLTVLRVIFPLPIFEEERDDNPISKHEEAA